MRGVRSPERAAPILRAFRGGARGRPNSRMRATADTRAVIFGYLAGRRVMRALCGGMAEGCAASRSPAGNDVIAPRAGFSGSWTPHNKRMHATADTRDIIYQQRRGAARDARR